MNRVTIVTPTYNRGYIIHRLIASVLQQTDDNFKWLVIDDGSSDNTEAIFSDFQTGHPAFSFMYVKTENGGKQRAINLAVTMVDTEYVFIVDSDDYLVPDAIGKINQWINDKEIDEQYAGVSGVKGFDPQTPVSGKEIHFASGYIDATNLEREQHGLSADMAEVYKTDILRKYPFEVFPGEKFVPEATVWDLIAKDGYKLRWHEDIIYICEYLPDGLTGQSWKLMRDNPMGYAKLFNTQLMTQNNKSWKTCLQMVTQLILGHHWTHIFKSSTPGKALICTPAAFLLSLRRRRQYKENIG